MTEALPCPRRKLPPIRPAGALLGLWTLPPLLSLSDPAPHCAVLGCLRSQAPRPRLAPSPLGTLQDLSPLLGGKQLRSPGVGQTLLLSQPHHLGSVVVLRVCEGAGASSRGPSPHPSAVMNWNSQLRESESDRCSPLPPGPFPHAAASWGRRMALPGQGLGTGALMSPGASHPWLERAIKCSGARRRIQAIFPSCGRSSWFFLVLVFFGGGSF